MSCCCEDLTEKGYNNSVVFVCREFSSKSEAHCLAVGWQVFTYLIISTNCPSDNAKAAAFPGVDKRAFNLTCKGYTQQQLLLSQPGPSEKCEVKRQAPSAILSWKWEIDGKGCWFSCYGEFSRMNTHIIITVQLIKHKSSWKVASTLNSAANWP